MVRRACADATAGAGGDHQRIGRKVGERAGVATRDRTLEPLQDLARLLGTHTVSGVRNTHPVLHRQTAGTLVHLTIDRQLVSQELYSTVSLASLTGG
jgi:hypothetical protein